MNIAAAGTASKLGTGALVAGGLATGLVATVGVMTVATAGYERLSGESASFNTTLVTMAAGGALAAAAGYGARSGAAALRAGSGSGAVHAAARGLDAIGTGAIFTGAGTALSAPALISLTGVFRDR
jgi:hypothetical protein